MNKTDLVAIRDYAPGDKNFIYASWLRGMYYGESWLSLMEKDVFMASYHKVIENLLDSPSAQIKIACLKDDADVILGYSVMSRIAPVVHWTFVKSAWRGIGIAKMLVPKETKIVTNLTKSGLAILRKHPGVTYNPLLVL